MSRRRTPPADPKAVAARKSGRGATAKRQQKSTPAARQRGGARRASTSRPRRSLVGRLLVWCLILGVWGAVAFGALLAYVAYDLPEVDSIAAATRRPSVRLLAADGSELASYGDLYGEPLTVEALPPYLPRAVLAVEDRRFYEHPGVDPFGLLRAAIANLRAGAIVQGGSTITQQLAKNLFLTPARTFERKLQEALLALQLERRFTKDQILSLYLNRVYLGAGTYGVDAAAHRYFGKSAREVGLYEAALLAGLLKAPSRYSPASNPELAAERTETVLDAMVAAGFVSARDAALAKGNPPTLYAADGGGGRYFADWALSEIEEEVGTSHQDLVVQTTLDPRLQAIAEAELARLLDGEGSKHEVSQGAVVLLSPDGAVRAMVGGRSYADSQFNRAVQALRQPGSAFKLFVFLAALEDGYSPDSRMEDAPIRVATATGPWTPENYADKYFGEVTLREAFARSLNSVAVRLTERVGPDAVVETARRLGITSPLAANPSLALGTSEVNLLELTGAYAVIANRGQGLWPYGVTGIADRSGHVLYRRSGEGPGTVVGPAAQGALVDMMQAVVGWGTGRGADPGRPAAGKTGTSQESRDAWFVGYTAGLVGGVWLGNDDGRPMRRVTGGSLPAQLWGRVMASSLKGQPVEPLPALRGPEAPSGGFLGRLFERLGVSSGSGVSSDRQQPRRAPAFEGARERMDDR